MPFRALGERALFLLLTLVLISIIVFAATGTSSARSIAVTALGREVSEEQLDIYIHRQGLDKSLVQRYGQWVADFVRGNWGSSYVTQRPVRPEVLPRLRRTAMLAFLALAFAVPIGLSIAVFTAARSGSRTDTGMQVGTVVIAAFPEFVIGIVLLMVFGVALGWLPVDNTWLTFGTPWQRVKTYVLPVATLAIVALPYIIRIGRAAAREAIAAPFTQAALLRGLSRRNVLWDHAMRNAATPILNAIGLTLIYLLGGVIIVENLFGIPGLGGTLVQAILQGDTPTVLAIAMLLGAMFVTINFIVDLLVLVFNPKLRAQ